MAPKLRPRRSPTWRLVTFHPTAVCLRTPHVPKPGRIAPPRDPRAPAWSSRGARPTDPMDAMKRTFARLAPAAVLGCALFGASLLSACERPTPPEGEARGPALYETCAQCHGADGGGMHEFTAPAIAGLPEWYLRSQLEKFKSGARGAHSLDANGLRMRGMARTLNIEGDVAAIATYVANMQAVEPAVVITTGDVRRGEALFATCVQCHGAGATGDEARHAPPLTNLNDWYVVSSLRLFKAGIRGTDPRDEWGLTMRPMSLGLADEQAMADVAAYIRTLRVTGG